LIGKRLHYNLTMFSTRFQRSIHITRHARIRMIERNMDDAVVLDVIETGRAKYKDASHLWLFKSVVGRHDNLLCAAVVLDDVLVVKTVMHHFDTRG